MDMFPGYERPTRSNVSDPITTKTVTSGAATVGQDSSDVERDTVAFSKRYSPLSYDSEVVCARQKRVTSGYLSDNNADVCDVVDAEIQRLTEQTRSWNGN